MNGTGVDPQDEWARQSIQEVFARYRIFTTPANLPLGATADSGIISC